MHHRTGQPNKNQQTHTLATQQAPRARIVRMLAQRGRPERDLVVRPHHLARRQRDQNGHSAQLLLQSVDDAIRADQVAAHQAADQARRSAYFLSRR